MSIVTLIAEFNLLNVRLKSALTGDLDISEVADLVRACAAKQTEIEHFRPDNPREAHEQLQFLLARARDEAPTSRERSAVILATELLNRRAAAYPVRSEGLAGQGGGTIVTREDSLISYVCNAVERLSLIGPDFRYVATSPANAAFYGWTQAAFVGRHLIDVIGVARFETRARARLERAFRGEPQEYTHPLEANGQARTMRCQIKPVRSVEAKPLGVLVYVRDVTGEVPLGAMRRSA